MKSVNHKTVSIDKKLDNIAKRIACSDLNPSQIKKHLTKKFGKNKKEINVLLTRIRSKRRELEIKEDVKKNIDTLDIYQKDNPNFQNLSQSHKKFHSSILKERKKQEEKTRKLLLNARMDVYNYFRSVGHAGGLEKNMLSNLDRTDRMKVIMQATEDFETYADYKRRLKSKVASDRLATGQLPKEGLSLKQEHLFNDALNDYKLEVSGRGYAVKKPDNVISQEKIRENLNIKKGHSSAQEKIETVIDYKPDITKVSPKHKKRAGELAKNVWYRTKDLSEEDIAILREMNYVEQNQDHPVYDFKGNFVGCFAYKPGRFSKESMHHFSKPFLLKEIVPSTVPLFRFEDPDKVVRTIDAVVTGENKGKKLKIAVEFQESHKIGADRILNKIEPLAKGFDFVWIICKQEYKYVYQPAKEKFANVTVYTYTELKNELKNLGLLK